MKPTLQQKNLNTVAKVLTNQIRSLESQGYENLYFKAQFTSGGEKQNGIERGDVSKIAKQVRDYVKSEQADTVNVEIIDEDKGKSVYRRKFTDLHQSGGDETPKTNNPGYNGFGGFNGFGEVEFNALVDKRVEAKEQAKDFARTTQELEDLRTKYKELEEEKAEIQAALDAKKQVEYYSGIIGTILPSLGPLFQGTPLAQAAGLLAGVGEAAKGSTTPSDEDVNSAAEMVKEFCNTLTPHEASSFHLLCAALEKDKSKIYSLLKQVLTEQAATKTQTQ